jgi:hypothetical protein
VISFGALHIYGSHLPFPNQGGANRRSVVSSARPMFTVRGAP